MPKSNSAPQEAAFSWPVRVYWEDTDAGGVVYHTGYLRFLERARSEWMRSRGVEQQRLRTEDNLLFVVCGMDVRFIKPARLDDMLAATLAIDERKSASVIFHQKLLRPADGALLLEAEVRVACIHSTSFRPRAIPPHLLQLF